MFISILQEESYMSQWFPDGQIMRKFGLSDLESVVASYFWDRLCDSGNYGYPKYRKLERKINYILVTPFTACSARLPVYAIIITYGGQSCFGSEHARNDFNVVVPSRFWNGYFLRLYFE
jgi:ferrous iron transport protein B